MILDISKYMTQLLCIKECIIHHVLYVYTAQVYTHGVHTMLQIRNLICVSRAQCLFDHIEMGSDITFILDL